MKLIPHLESIQCFISSHHLFSSFKFNINSDIDVMWYLSPFNFQLLIDRNWYQLSVSCLCQYGWGHKYSVFWISYVQTGTKMFHWGSLMTPRESASIFKGGFFPSCCGCRDLLRSFWIPREGVWASPWKWMLMLLPYCPLLGSKAPLGCLCILPFPPSMYGGKILFILLSFWENGLFFYPMKCEKTFVQNSNFSPSFLESYIFLLFSTPPVSRFWIVSK